MRWVVYLEYTTALTTADPTAQLKETQMAETMVSLTEMMKVV